MVDSVKLIERLPQKPPFRMIDEVAEIEEGRRAVAFKNISGTEYFFKGHFPGRPIMPGVMIIEAMAQTAILLFQKIDIDSDNSIYFLGSVKAKFINPVYPGDRLRLEASPIKIMRDIGLVETSAFVGDRQVAKGEISFSRKADAK